MDDPGLYQIVRDASLYLYANGGFYPEAEKEALVECILTRQNRRAGLIFHPTPHERAQGIRLFTGERARAPFMQNCVLELDTLRLLALLQPESPAVQALFQRANPYQLTRCYAHGCTVGECAHAQIVLMRYLTALDLKAFLPRIERTLNVLKEKRYHTGKWDGFPLYLTVLWLSELPVALAQSELDFIHPYALKLLRRRKNGTQVDLLRRGILKKAALPSPLQPQPGGAVHALSRAAPPDPPLQTAAR